MIIQQQLGRIWKKNIDCLIKSRRYLCVVVVEGNKQQQKNKYEKFKLTIKNEFPWTDNKRDCLIYMKTVFDSFQNMVNVKYVDQQRLNSNWRTDLSVNEVKEINESMIYVNNHQNFGLIKKYLIENFNKFDSKEIALINLMYKCLERDFRDNKTAKIINNLDNFCLNNINSFDLNDINNLSANKGCLHLIKASRDHVSDILSQKTETKIEKTISELEPERGYFENEMRNLDDKNSNLWLKLNTFKIYKGYLDIDASKEFISHAYSESLKNLKKIDSVFYKVNFFNTLFNRSVLHVKQRNLATEHPEYIEQIREDYFKEYLKNIDLIYSKLDLDKAIGFLMHNGLITEIEEGYLKNYAKTKLTSNSTTELEFFIYTKLFHDLTLYGSSIAPDKHRAKSNNQYLINYNLDDETKKKISDNFDEYIQDTGVLCLDALKGGLFLIYSVHSNQNSALKTLYERLIEMINHETMFLITPFVSTFIIGSNKITKDYEMKLSELIVKNGYEQFKWLETKRDILPLLMLNSETIVKNHELIKDLIMKDLYAIASLSSLSNVYYLFNRHFEVLIKEDTKATLELGKILYEKLLNELNRVKKTKSIEIIDISKIFLDTTKKAKSLYMSNLLTLEEYDKIFHAARHIEFENFSKFSSFNKKNNLQPYSQLASLVSLYKPSRVFSISNLNIIWLYLMENIERDIQQQSYHIGFLDNILIIMSMFNTFDFTKSSIYKKENEKFKVLNKKFYRKYRNIILQGENRLSNYATSLAYLHCFIPDVFDDILEKISMNARSARNKFNNVIPFLSLYYPKYENRLKLEYIFPKPNEKFLKDFKKFYSKISSSNKEQQLQNSHVFQLGINESNKIVPLNDPIVKTILPIVLIDSIQCYYDDDKTPLKITSFLIKCLKLTDKPLIVIKEHEFYEDKNILLKNLEKILK